MIQPPDARNQLRCVIFALRCLISSCPYRLLVLEDAGARYFICRVIKPLTLQFSPSYTRPHNNTEMAPRLSGDFVAVHDPPQPRLHGLLLTWDTTLLAQFVKAANAVVLVENLTLELPNWVTEPRGRLTTRGFVQDCMAYLSEISSGFTGTILSPLTPIQSLQLSRRLGQIEMHRFIQACAKKLPYGSCLASGTQFFEDPGTDGVPINFPGPPSPYRQIFR